MKKGENKENIDPEYLDMMNYNFNYALDNGLDNVYMGFMIIDDNYLKEMWVEKKNWIKILNILMDRSIELEEYEYANEFKKILECL